MLSQRCEVAKELAAAVSMALGLVTISVALGVIARV
jgi:hypothetical protein